VVVRRPADSHERPSIEDAPMRAIRRTGNFAFNEHRDHIPAAGRHADDTQAAPLAVIDTIASAIADTSD
jgi:hypothetical protein